MWLWATQCWHSTLVPVSDRVCRQRSVPYQPPTSGPVSEDAPSNLPLAPYASSKSAAVNGAEILGHWGGVIVYH